MKKRALRKYFKKRNIHLFNEEEISELRENTNVEIKLYKNKKNLNNLKKFISPFLFIVITSLILILIYLTFFRNFKHSKQSFKFLSKYISTNSSTLFNISITSILPDILNTSIILNISNTSDNLTHNKNILANNTNNHRYLSKEEALDRGIPYLEKCKNGILFNNITSNITRKPKISVVIPVYNSKKTIKSAIRSIQNQNMEDIEIILVEDENNEETKNIIENMKQEDERITILYNNKNMGTLFSRSIGSLIAKGEYILALDSDDMFLDKDVFEIIYLEAEKDNVDITAFKVLEGFNYYYNRNKIKVNYAFRRENNVMVTQPELGIFPITKNNTLYPNDIYIWGKLYNSKVYKSAVNLLGKERYSHYLNWVEDSVMFFIICNMAQSYKFVDKYGLFHFLSSSSSSLSISHQNRFNSEIFFLDVIFDFSKNNYKKYAAYKLMEIRNYNFYNSQYINSNEYFRSVVKKIMNCDYIEEKIKDKVRIKYENSTFLFGEKL